MSNLVEIEDFVSSELCDTIVKEIEYTPTIEAEKEQNFFANRSRNVEHFPTDTAKDIANEILLKARDVYKEDLIVDYSSVVTWYNGQKMDPHCDIIDITTGRAYDYCVSRVYSAILYLNDDYEGGETYFPKLGITIEPKKGKLVMFPSHIGYVHGVNEISTKTNRFTLAVWFSIKYN